MKFFKINFLEEPMSTAEQQIKKLEGHLAACKILRNAFVKGGFVLRYNKVEFEGPTQDDLVKADALTTGMAQTRAEITKMRAI